MFTISKTFDFHAAHQLMHHDGKCRNLHGHSWKARITFRSPTFYKDGPKTGMVVDYGDIKSCVQPIIDLFFEHKFMNETLATDSPTSEFVALWLYDRIAVECRRTSAQAHGLELVSVAIAETETSEVVYAPDLPTPVELRT
jgi:6-pyruvoyltetrahydropterin/6-carboxytetrahydropterin synthase